MHVPRCRRALALVALASVFTSGVAACNDDDGGGPSAYRSAITQSLRAEQGEGSVTFTTKEADCTAARLTAHIDDARLEELGVSPTVSLESLDFTADERIELFKAMDACVDFAAQIAQLLATEGSMTPEQARCVADRYVKTVEFKEAIVSSAPDEDLNARISSVLSKATTDCGAPALDLG